jgi:N-acetylmuramoyl-L-alanine amidase
MHRVFSLSLWFSLAAGLFGAAPALAAIEISHGDAPPVVIQDVYQRDGVAFIAIDEVLNVLGLTGQWDNVAHVYRIEMPGGAAVISPGSNYLRLDGQAVTVAHRPRFIDGKLRVSETFLTEQFAPFMRLPLQVRNLNPVAPPPPQNSIDELFALLLQQHPKTAADSEWVIAIDPGHGGQDAGTIGMDGTTERTVNLAVAEQLQKLLKMRRGAPVVMTRDADYAMVTSQRYEAVASGQADLLLSLHAQTHYSPRAQGIMLFVAPETVAPAAAMSNPPAGVAGESASRHLAEALREALIAAGYQVAPIQQRALLPLGQGNLPRVLVEMGYLSNETDLARLRDPSSQTLLARALYEGLEAFLKSYQDLQESSDESNQPVPPR